MANDPVTSVESGTRRALAAVMFSDIVGYTSMMQASEEVAHKARFRHKEVVEEVVEKFGGEVIQFYGDGSLSIFLSPYNAVRAAVEIQHSMRSEHIPLRIGLHSGDIARDETGIFGDPVNIASRVQSSAKPGSVFLTGKISEEIANHDDIALSNLGKFELKNVLHPVDVYAVDDPRLEVPRGTVQFEKSRPLDSVAVLPFRSLSNHPDNEFFCEGMSDELISALSRVNGVTVISRTSSFAFKDKHMDVREIGQKLNAGTVLEGSVRRSGTRLRISAQLVNTSTGHALWSERFDRELTDIFEVQDELASTIANYLRKSLDLHAVEKSLVGHPTQNIDAYNEYLKGKYYFARVSPADILKAIDHYREACVLDPSYAQPHAQLAISIGRLTVMGHYPTDEGQLLAREHAKSAMELNPDIPESYVALGLMRLFFDWDYDGCRTLLERALELSPGDESVLSAWVMYLQATGRFEDGVVFGRRLAEADPLSLFARDLYGATLFWNKNYCEARREFEAVIELDPGYRSARWHLGFLMLANGQFEDAIALFLETKQQLSDDLLGNGPLGLAYGMAGDVANAEVALAKLHERRLRDIEVNLEVDIAVVNLSLGRLDEGFLWLEKALAKKLGVFFVLTNPLFQPYMSEPGFVTILEKVHLLDQFRAVGFDV